MAPRNHPSALTDTHHAARGVDELAALVEHRMLHAVQGDARVDAHAAPDVTQACLHHLASGGRRARARLALQASLSLGLDGDDAVTLATAVELLHNASLIHDDLQDRDAMRRGVSSVWSRYGDNVAVCAGDLMLAAAYGALAGLLDRRCLPTLLASMTSRTRSAIHGQCADLACAGTAVDLAGYCEIVAAKSGALLSLPLELPLLCAGHADSVPVARRAAEAFAIGYQIADDIADVEIDAARPGRAASLNVVQVLQSRGDRDAALAEARGVALRHLGDAAVAASALPCGAGAALRMLALQLSARL